MARLLLFTVLVCISCTPAKDGPSEKNPRMNEDGESGPSVNSKREAMAERLQALNRSKSVEEESQAVTALLEALKKGPYKVRVEIANRALSKAELKKKVRSEPRLKVEISCPYFAPVTPWTTHKFLDSKNLLALEDVILEK